MNYNTDKEIQDAFSSVFSTDKDENDIKLQSRLIMYRFLSEVERLCDDKGINRKQLAGLIGTSASYITQLYRGNKLLNLETAAKFQKALNIKFNIKAYTDQGLIVANRTGIKPIKDVFSHNSASSNLMPEKYNNIRDTNNLELIDKGLKPDFHKSSESENHKPSNPLRAA